MIKLPEKYDRADMERIINNQILDLEQRSDSANLFDLIDMPGPGAPEIPERKPFLRQLDDVDDTREILFRHQGKMYKILVTEVT